MAGRKGERKNKLSRAKQIQRMERINLVEKYLLRGITNQEQLAAALGCSTVTIDKYIAVIYERWQKNQPATTEQQRMKRVRQIESIAVLALNEFETSRNQEKVLTIKSRPCLKCNGKGHEQVSDDDTISCKECQGTGKIIEETRSRKTKTGDPAYLNLAKICFEAAAKLEGVYPATSSMQIKKTLVEETAQIGGTVHKMTTEIFYEAPAELLIQAKATLDQLRYLTSNGDAKREVVEATATVVEGEPPELEQEEMMSEKEMDEWNRRALAGDDEEDGNQTEEEGESDDGV